MEEEAVQDRSLPVDLIEERPVADPFFPTARYTNQVTRDLFQEINSDIRIRPSLPLLPPLNPADLQAPPAQTIAPSEGKKKRKKASSQPGPNSRGGKATQFTQEETHMLLDLVEEVLPVGQEQWKIISNDFNSRVEAKRRRTDEGIRRKFNSLAATKIPTGNPNMPEDVYRAKAISEQIYLKCHPITGDEGGAAEGGDEFSDSTYENEERVEEAEREAEEEAVETPAVERNRVPASISTSVSTQRNARRLRGVNKKGGKDASFMSAFLSSSQMQLEQQKIAIDQQKLMMEQNKNLMEQQMKQNMQQSTLMLNAFLTGVNGLISTYVSVNQSAIPGTVPLPPPTAGVPIAASLPTGRSSDSEEEELSSIHSDDSPPYVEAKIVRGCKISSKCKKVLASPVKATTPVKATPVKRKGTPTKRKGTPTKGTPKAVKKRSLPTKTMKTRTRK